MLENPELLLSLIKDKLPENISNSPTKIKLFVGVLKLGLKGFKGARFVWRNKR